MIGSQRNAAKPDIVSCMAFSVASDKLAQEVKAGVMTTFDAATERVISSTAETSANANTMVPIERNRKWNMPRSQALSVLLENLGSWSAICKFRYGRGLTLKVTQQGG